MAPCARTTHTTPIFLGFTSTHNLSPQMDHTDARCVSSRLEAYFSQRQQSQRDHHETEQTFNDVFHAPKTRESPTTQEPEVGSHREKGKHTPLGQFRHSQHTRVLTSCGDVEAALRHYNREGITKWGVILAHLRAETSPIDIKYAIFSLLLASITSILPPLLNSACYRTAAHRLDTPSPCRRRAPH